jgi:hypothetical protein
MNEPLHPLSLAEILDKTAQLYRSRFLVFVGIGTIPAGTVFVLAAGTFAFMAWMGANSRHGGSVADVFVWVFLLLLFVIAVPLGLGANALGEAAMTDAAAHLFLGETFTIRSTYRTAWKRGWRYLGLYTLQGLIIFGPPIVVFSLAIAGLVAVKVAGSGANDNSPLFGGLVFLLFAVVGVFLVWMLLRLCLAFPASVVEQAAAVHSLRRGTLLSHGTRSRILLLYVLGLILNQVLAWGVTFPVLIAMELIPGLQGPAHAQVAGVIAMFVMYGSFFAVKALTKPIYGIALTLFYFDQRIRKEGFDIEWMMQQAGMTPVPAPIPEDIQVAQPPLPTDPATSPIAEQLVLAEDVPAIEPVSVAVPTIGAAPEEGKA